MVTPDVLAQSGLFADLPPEVLAQVVELAQEVTHPTGTVLFEEGTPARDAYILLAGKVAIQVTVSNRPEPITTVILAQPGVLVGWSGLVGRALYTARGVCQIESRLLVLDGAALMGVLEAHPAAGFVVMRRVAEVISLRLRTMQQHVLGTV